MEGKPPRRERGVEKRSGEERDETKQTDAQNERIH